MNDNSADLISLVFEISRMVKDELSLADIGQLSILQIHTLKYLSHHQSATMSEIADFLRIEMPSATSLINKLVRQKLAVRQSDESDRRRVRIVLTAEGTHLLQEALEARNKKLEQLFGYLSPEEKQTLVNILKTVKKNLQA